MAMGLAFSARSFGSGIGVFGESKRDDGGPGNDSVCLAYTLYALLWINDPRLLTILKLPLFAWAMYMFIRT